MSAQAGGGRARHLLLTDVPASLGKPLLRRIILEQEGTEMRSTDTKVRAAHARWELQLAILQEDEKRLLDALKECSLKRSTLPQEKLDRLKTSRAQCNEAFQALMGCFEEGALSPGR